MQFCNTKEGLTELLQDNLAKTYKRKRLKLDDPTEEPKAKESIKNDDMDIQESDDDSNEAPVLFPQPRPSSSAAAAAEESNSILEPDDELEASGDSIQLSLLELKRKQEEILKALEDASSDSNTSPSDQIDIQPKDADLSTAPTVSINNEDNANDIEQSTLETTMDTTIEMSESMNPAECGPNTPSSSTAGHSILAVVGTPLIKQMSPFSKLPVGDKWSVGVTDVIDFENLPDATGTYQKLTGVIDKVRTTIKRINDETGHDSS